MPTSKCQICSQIFFSLFPVSGPITFYCYFCRHHLQFLLTNNIETASETVKYIKTLCSFRRRFKTKLFRSKKSKIMKKIQHIKTKKQHFVNLFLNEIKLMNFNQNYLDVLGIVINSQNKLLKIQFKKLSLLKKI